MNLFYIVCYCAAVYVGFTTSLRRSVLRLRRDGTMIADSGDGAWSLGLLNGSLILAHLSPEYRAKYGATWMFGYRREFWFYYPREAARGTR